MSEHTPSGPEMTGAQIDIVERVLGMPLLPNVEGVSLTSGTIQRFAFDSVWFALEKRRHSGDWPGNLQITDSTIEYVRAQPEIKSLANQVAAANSTLETWQNPPPMPVDADTPDTARGRFQARSMATIVAHSQQAPINTEKTNNSPYKDGLLTVAPPGGGKTALQALAVNYAGIGLPISREDPRRRKAVGIANSKILIEQALDPSETMHRFINVGGRDIRIGAYYTHRHDGHDEYDLLMTTPDSYPMAAASGAVDTETTARYMLDEAHRIAMAPTMERYVTQFGSSLYMFTATPAISGGRRDLRKQFPHAQFGSMREFIEDGILSPVQLFSYRAGEKPGSAEQLAIRLAADYVRSGRKTLIVCQPGEFLTQARDITRRLNELHDNKRLMPHPRFEWQGDTIACAVGTFPGADTKADLARLRRGERLIAATVATGNEGLNIPDLDALIVIGPQGAHWRVDQWLGRILRPSGRLAVASEILPHELQPGKPLASIFSPFGVDRLITAGYYVGPVDTPSGELAMRSESIHLSPPEIPLPPLAENYAPATVRQPSPPEDQKYTPPQEVSEYLIDNIPLREATIAPSDLAKMAPPHYRPLTGLAPENVPIEWLYNMLDKLDIGGFLDELTAEEREALDAQLSTEENNALRTASEKTLRYVGVWEPDETGEPQFLRYYSPLAALYFKKHPIPELASDSEFLDEDIAILLGVSRNFVRDTIEKLGIEPLERITKYHRKPRYFGIDTLQKVAIEANKIPMADESDVAVPDLKKDISPDYVKYYIRQYQIFVQIKRRNPLWGIVGNERHISEADAEEIRSTYEKLGVADLTKLMGYTEIAKTAGVTLNTVLNKVNALPQDAQPETIWLRSSEKVRPAEFVDRAWGMAFVEYIKPEKVLPWETTLAMVALYFGKKKANMHQILGRRVTPESINIPLPGVSAATVFPLSILLDLQRGWGPLKPAANAPRLDAEQAALSPADAHDISKVAYSQHIQKAYIPPEQIAQPDEIAYYMSRRETPPPLPQPIRISSEATVEKQQAAELTTRNTILDITAVLHVLNVKITEQQVDRIASEDEMITPILNDPSGKVMYSHYAARRIIKTAQILSAEDRIN